MKLYCETCDQIYDTASGPLPLTYPDRHGKRFRCSDCDSSLTPLASFDSDCDGNLRHRYPDDE